MPINKIIFDMDGVITSEQAYFNAAALSVFELLNSNKYFGYDKQFKDKIKNINIEKIRKEIFFEDKVITAIKNKGINTNWDLTFITFCVFYILKKIHDKKIMSSEVFEFIEKTECHDFEFYEFIKMNMSKHSGYDSHIFERNGELWQICREVFQEWFLGSEAYFKEYGLKAMEGSKPPMDEKLLFEPEIIKNMLDTLKSKKIYLGVATGRPENEILPLLKKLNLFNYFDKIVTYDDVLRAEKKDLQLTKPHPYMFLKAILNTEDVFDYEGKDFKDVLIVGDTRADFIPAKKIGAKFMAVLTGIHGKSAKEFFESEGADFVCDNVLEIEKIIENTTNPIPRLALVHDWLTNIGGAEYVLKNLTDIFCDAPIYTMVYNKKNMKDYFENRTIKTSFIQKIPFGVSKYRMFLPIMPYAVETFDLSGYDIVLSSSMSCVKGVLTPAYTKHICYCHSPMRYVHDLYYEHLPKNPFKKLLQHIMAHKIRLWDVISANRVDIFIANSKNVAARIKKHYKRDSIVVYPPADTLFYTPFGAREDFYLIVSRLVPYKRVDIAISAFNKLKRKLIVIGEGPELKKLKSKAGKNIEFPGRISKDEVREYYRKCKTLIFTPFEDFGIVPVEAQCCGSPVIAFGKGGALETVIENETGVFFDSQTPESLAEAVLRFEKMVFNFDNIRKHAEKFSEDIFKEKILNIIKGAIE